MSTDHNFWRERRAEADSNQGPSTYQPNALQLGQTGWHHANNINDSCIALYPMKELWAHGAVQYDILSTKTQT